VGLLGTLVAVSVVLGCGGDDSADIEVNTLKLWGNCAAAAPCGGDATGSWQSEGLCVPQGYGGLSEKISEFPPECGNALSVEALEPDTVLELRSDQSYSEKGTLNLVVGMRMDASCFGAVSGESFSDDELPLACNLLEQQLRSGSSGPFDAASCAVSDGACGCNVTGTQRLQSGGSFEVRGDTLVLGAGQGERFCAAGDTLTLEVDDPTFGRGLLVYRRAGL
jgi:hypothetical protein